jgi:hypothetical protein
METVFHKNLRGKSINFSLENSTSFKKLKLHLRHFKKKKTFNSVAENSSWKKKAARKGICI